MHKIFTRCPPVLFYLSRVFRTNLLYAFRVRKNTRLAQISRGYVCSGVCKNTRRKISSWDGWSVRSHFPRYHSNCASLRRSAGSDKPYALTRHLRKALHGDLLFQSSARKGWDSEPAHRRVSTLSGSLNAACSSVFVTAFVMKFSEW